jgi:hypothetical protein
MMCQGGTTYPGQAGIAFDQAMQLIERCI